MKPYQLVTIQECDEPLVEISCCHFARETPHPYLKLSAPYGERSPYYLRQGVLEKLLLAQIALRRVQPDWNIQIFDAYRPIAVQQYMVSHTFEQLLQAQNLIDASLSPEQRQALLQEVYQFWAEPSLDPATPPPHSTGAAVDVTLVDAAGVPVEMGSPIDEMSPRSYPDHYAALKSEPDRIFHQNRLLLRQSMAWAGFEQHPNEWWHFSYGDQLWAWLVGQRQVSQKPINQPIARYGNPDKG
jgi:zinc D-Ala-D-Ala dipeptidase